MPRLWIMSDLHLEAVPYPRGFCPAPPEFDVLVVAGDVWEGESARGIATVAELAAGRPAVFAPGNHEYWNQELWTGREAVRRAAGWNAVTLLDDGEAEIAGVRFIGGTLWTDGRLGGQDAKPDRPTGEEITVVDGGRIRPITFGDEAALHRHTTRFIERGLASPRDDRPIVVVTHHAPHPVCIPEAYRDCRAAGIAASDLSHLTDAGLVDVWVHGHIHHTAEIVRPGGTRIVCNAAGRGFDNPGFRDAWVIEV